MGDEMKKHGKEIVNYIVKLKQTGIELKDVLTKESQLSVLKDKQKDLEKEIGLKIKIVDADSKEAHKQDKANSATPDKPGLLFE